MFIKTNQNDVYHVRFFSQIAKNNTYYKATVYASAVVAEQLLDWN